MVSNERLGHASRELALYALTHMEVHTDERASVKCLEHPALLHGLHDDGDLNEKLHTQL